MSKEALLCACLILDYSVEQYQQEQVMLGLISGPFTKISGSRSDARPFVAKIFASGFHQRFGKL